MIRQRVISAACIAVLLLAALLLLPPGWSAAALSLVLVVGAWEWAGFVALRGFLPRAAFMLAVAALCALWWQLSGSATLLRSLLWFALVFWSVALVWVFWLPHRINRTLVGVAGVLALSLAWLALVRMRVGFPHGERAVLYALLIVWLADSGAYFAGRAFGGRKLAPSVSPGKTWAGFWGGLVACGLLALVTATTQHLPVAGLLAVTLLIGVYSVVGDLTESLCKRFAGLKDSGTLIPGHGGMLDRFDSLLAAAPLLLLGLELLPGLQG
ncbi:MAG: phosphatidate cytidylyltransferase [Steroidobacteraceae bacterium]